MLRMFTCSCDMTRNILRASTCGVGMWRGANILQPFAKCLKSSFSTTDTRQYRNCFSPFLHSILGSFCNLIGSPLYSLGWFNLIGNKTYYVSTSQDRIIGKYVLISISNQTESIQFQNICLDDRSDILPPHSQSVPHWARFHPPFVVPSVVAAHVLQA